MQIQSNEIWDIIVEINRAQRIRREASTAGDGKEATERKTSEKADGEAERTVQQSPASKCNCMAKKCPAGPKGPRGPPGGKGEVVVISSYHKIIYNLTIIFF